MLSNYDVQAALKALKLYDGPLDGIIGPASKRGIDALVGRTKASEWSDKRKFMAAMQIVCKSVGCDPGPIDGLYGALTDAACDCYAAKVADVELDNTFRDYETPVKANNWPTQRNVGKFYGYPGREIRKQLVTLQTIPYELDYYGQTVKRVTLHTKCTASWLRIQEKILAAYGEKELRDLGIHRYGGTYNHRRMRGGRSWSMHAYACAEDRYPEKNRLRWGRDRALFAQPEYLPFIEAYESEGWINLGRERNFDWMHFQAARLS